MSLLLDVSNSRGEVDVIGCFSLCLAVVRKSSYNMTDDPDFHKPLIKLLLCNNIGKCKLNFAGQSLLLINPGDFLRANG